MAPLIVESCNVGFNEPPVGEVGVLPPSSPGCAALVARRRMMLRTRHFIAPCDLRDEKTDPSLFLQLRVALQRNICDSATDAPALQKVDEPPGDLSSSPSTTTTSRTIGSGGYVPDSPITSSNNNLGGFAQATVSHINPFQLERVAYRRGGENIDGNDSSRTETGVKHDAGVKNSFRVTAAADDALQRQILSSRRTSPEAKDSECSGISRLDLSASFPLKRPLPSLCGTERVILAEPDSTTPNTPEQTSPPPRKRCRWNSSNKNSLYSPLRESLIGPSTPAPASPSLMANFLNRSFTSSQSTVLHPSASKLPSATLNKPLPPPAPSLVQPQPLVPGFYESHLFPSSPCPLFERLYCASSVLEYKYATEVLLPRRNLCPPSPSSSIQSPTSSKASSQPSSHLTPKPSCVGNSSSAFELRTNPERGSCNPLLSVPSSSTRLPASSLASLLSSSSGVNLKETLPRSSGSSSITSDAGGKLPQFRESFNTSSLARGPVGEALSRGGLGATDSTPNGYQGSGNIHIPFEGKMCPLPYVEKVPQFTRSFFRTLTSLVCKHCRQDSHSEPPSLHCRGRPLYSLFVGFKSTDACTLDVEKFPPTSVHVACLLHNPAPILEKLLAAGFPPNYPNLVGQTALHAVLLGDIHGTGLPAAVSTLLAGGASPHHRDRAGDTPLLYVRNLLKEHLYSPAFTVASLLLGAGAEVDDANNEGRTLLSYSLSHGDKALGLTRLLVDHGANIWGSKCKDSDQSAFLHIFTTAMQLHSLAPLLQSLHLICRLMSRQPGRMRAHLQRNMTSHGRCHVVYKGLSSELLRLMEPYYKQPQSLSSLAALVVREALPLRGDKVRALEQLPLPPKLRRTMLFLD